MPYKGRNFNPRTLGKCFYFVICMISRHGFQAKLLPYIAYFWRFWGENVIFSLYNQPKTENIYKTLPPPPPHFPTPHISEMCIYITNNLCKWDLGTRGGGNVLQTKNRGGPASSTWNTLIKPMENHINGKLFDKTWHFAYWWFMI